jgi:hypothetical protein
VDGLFQLNGQAISVLADQCVVASPNNPNYPTPLVVAQNQITLPRPAAVIQAGLPITCDLETLDIDMAQGEPLAWRFRGITNVSMYLESTRGLWAGATEPAAGDNGVVNAQMSEVKYSLPVQLGNPIALLSEIVEPDIMGQWNNNGRVFIRQVDPLPAAILAVYPSGYIPIPGTEGR